MQGKFLTSPDLRNTRLNRPTTTKQKAVSDIPPHHIELLDARAKFAQPKQDYMDRVMLPLPTKDKALPLLVGVLSLILAYLVAALDAAYGVNAPRSSISHYFYAPVAGTAFVVILAFISAFMFSYRGQSQLDGRITTFGAICALLVAIFPTENVGVISGEPFDHRFVSSYAVVETENGKVVTENTGRGGIVARAFGYFATPVEITVQGSGDDVIEVVHLIANGRSQFVHQLGAIGLIGSLIALSFVHMLRKSWVVYNVAKGSCEKRPVGPVERLCTFICILCMGVGAWLAIGYPEGAASVPHLT